MGGHRRWPVPTRGTIPAPWVRPSTRSTPPPTIRLPAEPACVEGSAVAWWTTAVSLGSARVRGAGQRHDDHPPAEITPHMREAAEPLRHAPLRSGYPRLRGEQRHPGSGRTIAAGPPPRAREANPCLLQNRHPLGITPACAGSSIDGRGGMLTPWDHPRVRGEQPSSAVNAGPSGGSPPRARGAAGLSGADPALPGITPACAGSRPSTSPGTSGGWDHPRVRGEQGRAPLVEHHNAGSPPRARGAG